MLEHLHQQFDDRFHPGVEDESVRGLFRDTIIQSPDSLENTALRILEAAYHRNSPNKSVIASCLQVLDTTTLSSELRSYIGLSECVGDTHFSVITDEPLHLLRPARERWRITPALEDQFESFYRRSKFGCHNSLLYPIYNGLFTVQFEEIPAGIPTHTFEVIDKNTQRGYGFIQGVWYFPHYGKNYVQETAVFSKISSIASTLKQNPSQSKELEQLLLSCEWQADRMFKFRLPFYKNL